MRIYFTKAFNSWLGRSGSTKREQMKFCLSIFIPIVLLFFIIRIYPIISNFTLSLTNAHLIRPVTKFVGLENFFVLFKDKQFIQAFFNSLEFLAIAVPAEIFLGLFFSILISRKIKFEGFFLTLYFIPYLLPMVSVMIIWMWFFTPGNFGLANYLLSLINVQNIHWMSNSRILLLVIIGIHIWKNLGLFIVVFLMALKAVPRDIIEAAKVDGASEWQTITRIELPIIKPTILFGTVLATIVAWSVFTEVFMMIQGTDASSGTSVQVLAVRMYQELFTYSNTGRGAAISVILFIMSAIFILIEFTIFREKKN